MKRYIKTIDGKTIIKRTEEIVIKGNGSQTFNPKEDAILADGWVEYIPQPHVPTIEEIKASKVDAILAYDRSEAVNEFSMGGLPIWLDKATRAGLLLRFEAESKVGRETTTLWYGGQSFTLPLAQAQQILIALELYASECYDRTQAHIAAVNAMESKEAVEAYDYTTGYPAKLNF